MNIFSYTNRLESKTIKRKKIETDLKSSIASRETKKGESKKKSFWIAVFKSKFE